jgi:hypothetical protein
MTTGPRRKKEKAANDATGGRYNRSTRFYDQERASDGASGR